MLKIKIFGAANCGNVGDDLIAYVLENYLAKHINSKDIQVSFIAQQQQFAEIPDTDILIIGGGGLIYDYDINNVINYCKTIKFAHDYRVPVFFMGMGVQHVFSDEAKEMYRDALQYVKAIAVRGEEDARYIREELGYSSDLLITSRDLVFLYDDIAQPGNPLRAGGGSGKPVLALSLADWRLGENYSNIHGDLAEEYTAYRQYINSALPKLTDVFDVKIVCQASEDQAICRELADSISGEVIEFPSIETSPGIIELYRSVDYVITNRYHGLIAAIIADTPVIATSFSTHKSERLIKDSFPSLREQSYSIKEFVSEDIFQKMCDPNFRTGLQSASRREYRKCLKLARQHKEIVYIINNEISKMGNRR